MNISQLLILFHTAPADSLDMLEKRDELDEELVARLIKRRHISKTIADAEEDNLFEAIEHLSGANSDR